MPVNQSRGHGVEKKQRQREAGDLFAARFFFFLIF
jgi:hypothetical protein